MAGLLFLVPDVWWAGFYALWVPQVGSGSCLRLVNTRNAPAWTSGGETMVYLSLRGLRGLCLRERGECCVKLAGLLFLVPDVWWAGFYALRVPQAGSGPCLRLVNTGNAPAWTSDGETMVYLSL
jgi:hypothetical protein